MVEETLKIIRDTEHQAEQIEDEAVQKCRKILQEAQQKADRLVSDRAEQLKQKESEMTARAKEDIGKMTADAKTLHSQEIARLKEGAAGRREAAVAAVLSEFA